MLPGQATLTLAPPCQLQGRSLARQRRGSATLDAKQVQLNRVAASLLREGHHRCSNRPCRTSPPCCPHVCSAVDAMQSEELPDFSLEAGGFALDGFALEASGGGGSGGADSSDEGSESE